MTFLIQQTLIYAVPLMIVALAGVFAERSGIINLALEGIMIFGAFIGVLFVRTMQGSEVFAAAKAAGDYATLQGLELMAMVIAAMMGAIFSLLLSFASINLRADQTIGGTALNLMAPALVLFLIRMIANQNTLQMADGDSASWFMIKKTMFGYGRMESMGPRISVSCFSSFCPSCCIRRASACVCGRAAKIRRQRILWGSTFIKCATQARPFPVRWQAWAALSIP